jgi:hypothetical protein
MYTHVDRALHQNASAAQLCLYFNIAIAGASAFDYFVEDRPSALLSLVIFILLINGGALLLQRHAIKDARRREAEEQQHDAPAQGQVRSSNVRVGFSNVSDGGV